MVGANILCEYPPSVKQALWLEIILREQNVLQTICVDYELLTLNLGLIEICKYANTNSKYV